MLTSVERSKTWREKNSARKKEYQDEYRANHRDEINRRRRKYYVTNRTQIRSVATRRIDKLKAELYNIFGKRCVQCGFDDVRALQLDHINGGGAQERRGKTAAQVWRNAINNPEGYQMLCANCNSIKRYTHGEGCLLILH